MCTKLFNEINSSNCVTFIYNKTEDDFMKVRKGHHPRKQTINKKLNAA